jgi:peptidoglycan/LPS O-acetylase OafA/YrhL
MQPPKRSARLAELDGLRGLAAVAVVLFHFTCRYDEMFAPRGGLWIRFAGGQFGVSLFFMISGFVILMTLERTVHPGQFLWRRFTRLYPAYWAAVALTFAVVAWYQLPGQAVSPATALLNLTMIQRLLGADHVDGVYWSLQAELLFYAAMVVVGTTVGLRRLVPVLFAWLLAGLSVQLLLPVVRQSSPAAGALLTKLSTLANLPYIHLFAIGIALYAWHQGRRDASLLALIALAVAIHTLVRGCREGLVVAGLASLLAAAIGGQLPVLRGRPVVWLGTISYSLYLVHQNIGYCVIQSLDARGVNPNLGVAAATAIGLVLAVGLTYLVEKPALEWLRQFPLSHPVDRSLAPNSLAS